MIRKGSVEKFSYVVLRKQKKQTLKRSMNNNRNRTTDNKMSLKEDISTTHHSWNSKAPHTALNIPSDDKKSKPTVQDQEPLYPRPLPVLELFTRELNKSDDKESNEIKVRNMIETLVDQVSALVANVCLIFISIISYV